MFSRPAVCSVVLAVLVCLPGCEVVESNRTAPSPASIRAAGGAGPRLTTSGSPSGGVLEAEKMSPRLQYRGFSLAKPGEKEWYLNMKEQTPQRAILHRRVKSPTRTVYFAAGLNLIDRAPQSPEDFLRLVKPNLSGDGALQKPVYTPRLTTVGGQPAVAYELSASLGAGRDGKTRVLRDRGLIILHPGHPVTVVQAVFSQRGNEGELDETLESEGRALLEGVQALASLD